MWKQETPLGPLNQRISGDIALARHHAHPALAAHLVHPVVAARPDARGIARRRIDREQRVILGDREVVHQRAVRSVEPLLA